MKKVDSLSSDILNLKIPNNAGMIDTAVLTLSKEIQNIAARLEELNQHQISDTIGMQSTYFWLIFLLLYSLFDYIFPYHFYSFHFLRNFISAYVTVIALIISSIPYHSPSSLPLAPHISSHIPFDTTELRQNITDVRLEITVERDDLAVYKTVKTV